MTITDVTASDAKELLDIYGPYVANTAISFEYDVPTEADFAERIRTITKKYPYLKAVDEETGKILGYAYASTFKARAAYDFCVETSIYVRQDCRGNGVGRLLYEALEVALREQGILNMNACITSPKEADEYLNDDSVRFHEKMGFAPVGTFHDCGFKFGNWYNMMWMEKMIGEHR